MRDHLLAVYAQTGKMPAPLRDAPAMPEGTGLVWTVFLFELSPRRAYSATGRPLPISFTELDAFQRLTRVRLTAGEVAAILALDRVLLEVF